MTNNNQTHFEVIRDLVEMIRRLKPGENIAISVTRHSRPDSGNTELFDCNQSPMHLSRI